MTSKNTVKDWADHSDEADETGEQEGIFAKVGHAFAAAGGAITGVKDGEAIASAT